MIVLLNFDFAIRTARSARHQSQQFPNQPRFQYFRRPPLSVVFTSYWEDYWEVRDKVFCGSRD